MPDITFIATANAVALTGRDAGPRRRRSGHAQHRSGRVERAITPRTRAVVPVHVSGRAAAMDAIMASRARRTASPWSKMRPKRSCRGATAATSAPSAMAGCLSFSPNKTITTGQGGIVVTDDDCLAVRLRELKDQGRPVRGTGGDDVHAVLGYNFKLTNLQAAVGLGQLGKLEERVAQLQEIYRCMRRARRRCRRVRLLPFDVDARRSRRSGSMPSSTIAMTWSTICRARDIHCRPFWFPIHTQAPYRSPDADFPVQLRGRRRARSGCRRPFSCGRRRRLVCEEIGRSYGSRNRDRARPVVSHPAASAQRGHQPAHHAEDPQAASSRSRTKCS